MAAAFVVSAEPQSSQNADVGAFSELHCGQRRDSGLPQVAELFASGAFSHAFRATHRFPLRAIARPLYHPVRRGAICEEDCVTFLLYSDR